MRSLRRRAMDARYTASTIAICVTLSLIAGVGHRRSDRADYAAAAAAEIINGTTAPATLTVTQSAPMESSETSITVDGVTGVTTTTTTSTSTSSVEPDTCTGSASSAPAATSTTDATTQGATQFMPEVDWKITTSAPQAAPSDLSEKN